MILLKNAKKELLVLHYRLIVALTKLECCKLAIKYGFLEMNDQFTQGAVLGSHVLISCTHTSKSACYFVDTLRCVSEADQNMATYNGPILPWLQLWIRILLNKQGIHATLRAQHHRMQRIRVSYLGDEMFQIVKSAKFQILYGTRWL